MADGDQVQGLPPGAIVKPIQGLPPGSVVRPVKAPAPDPLVTGQGMEDAAHAQARPKPGVLPEPKPGVISSFGETTGLTHGTDPASDAASQVVQIGAHPLDEFGRATKQLGMAPVNLADSLVRHPIDTATTITGGPQFAEGVQNRNPAQMIGALAGGGLNAYGLTKVGAAAPEAADAAAGALNRVGAPIPPTVGEVANKAFRNQETGAIAVTPPAILDRMVPKNPEPVDLDAQYSERGDALMQRQAQQDALDAQNASRLKEVETSRQKELADQERLRTMDADARTRRGRQQERLDSSNAQNLSEAEKSRQQELADQERFRQQDADSRNDRIGDTAPPKIGKSAYFSVDRPEPQGFVPKVGASRQVVSSSTNDSVVPRIGAEPEPSQIADPYSPAPPVNKTLVSYPRENLLKLVQDRSTPYADRVAYIRELRRSPGSVPKSTIDDLSRYMVEPGAVAQIYGGPTQ